MPALTSFKKFLKGVTILPVASVTGTPEKGSLWSLTGTGALVYSNGTTGSQVLTASHSATVTNKTLEANLITLKLRLNSELNNLSGANATVTFGEPYVRLIGTGTGVAGLEWTDGATPGNVDGQTIILTNATSGSVLVRNESLVPTATNRILTGLGTDVTIPQNGSAVLIYSTSSSRWHLVSGNLTSSPSALNVTTITTSTTLTSGNDYVLVNGTGVTVDLPISVVAGKTFNIKKIYPDLVPVTIQCASATIDGQASVAITQQYDSLTIASDGANYFIL